MGLNVACQFEAVKKNFHSENESFTICRRAQHSQLIRTCADWISSLAMSWFMLGINS